MAVLQTERLIYLLTTDDIMLTGMRFFSITRNFMLAVRMNQDLMENSSVFHNTIAFLSKKSNFTIVVCCFVIS